MKKCIVWAVLPKMNMGASVFKKMIFPAVNKGCKGVCMSHMNYSNYLIYLDKNFHSRGEPDLFQMSHLCGMRRFCCNNSVALH